MCRGLIVINIVVTLAVLHPLEYVAMNTLAGGTRGAYGKFELDYWAVAATEALRRLERRLDYDLPSQSAEGPPSILICIPWREWMVGPILRRPWIIETDPDKADFIIESQRSRCAEGKAVVLIDEVKRFDRAPNGAPTSFNNTTGNPTLDFLERTALDAQLSSEEILAVTSRRPARTIVDMVKWLDDAGIELTDIRIKRPSLEDAFIELTGKSLRE